MHLVGCTMSLYDGLPFLTSPCPFRLRDRSGKNISVAFWKGLSSCFMISLRRTTWHLASVWAEWEGPGGERSGCACAEVYGSRSCSMATMKTECKCQTVHPLPPIRPPRAMWMRFQQCSNSTKQGSLSIRSDPPKIGTTINDPPGPSPPPSGVALPLKP